MLNEACAHGYMSKTNNKKILIAGFWLQRVKPDLNVYELCIVVSELYLGFLNFLF